MRFMTKIVLALLLVAFAAMPVMAADHELAQKSTLNEILKRGELRVGLDAGYMPFEMTDKKGEIVGFDVDIAKEMAKAMGVKLTIVNTDYDGIIPALMADKFDIIISGMTVNQERNLQINFADPYIVVGQAILLNKKHEGTISSYKNLNDPKYTVVSRIGTTGEQAAKRMIPKAQYKSFEKEADGAMEVVNGQADAFVYDLPFNVVFMAQQGGKNLLLLDKVFTYEPLGFGIKKGDSDFLNWLDNFLAQIKNDGRFDRVYDKWIKGTEWLKDIQ
ncbi:transporter substrate-binding domain-containing protein [Desulfomicrobium sp. ZS1]|jgi:polar amino acid transport system substrate-binding protein|uniref:transporter substrate-binding domain-containing protein n=1 Tax=Desulfomicrobium sp. ZS1 TaxID=2952228 RepID=UPI0020B3135F|nr:transporter substrate-binding domain-containing protein [Desulfomicrobium sp. ZS1]UTF48744.1 transporter substrate-binding domain-containing protein [Desulfomicrobium sp. ZS1]